MGVCGAGVYLALRHTTATNAVLIYTTSPDFIVLIEMMIGRRPPSFLQFAGIAVATFGVAVIVAKGSPASLVTAGFNIGDLGMLAAAVAWAVYSVLLRDPRIQALPDTAVFAAVAGLGALANAPFWLVEGAHHGFVPETRAAWMSIAALAVVPSVVAFLGYQWGVRQVGAARAGMVLYFLPIAGVALATLFLGETVHAYHLVGTLCTIGGVLVATLPGRLRRKRS
jgi:drug/metabolite transporter (DMT)-like permease